MSACCNHDHASPAAALSPRYRRVLWLALVLNAAMFAVELSGGVHVGSVSLLADALDFFGDAANYGISLAVMGMALHRRARAAWFKGASMGVYGVLVLAQVLINAFSGHVPEPTTMGVIGAMALAVNVLVAVLLYAWRDGDANMRSVWLCSRNDAIGNVAVMLAALGVFGTGTGWPDVLVAVAMALLALAASRTVMRQANAELRGQVAPAPDGQHHQHGGQGHPHGHSHGH